VMSDIEIKALVFYQKHVAAKFKKADEIVNGGHLTELFRVQSLIRDLKTPSVAAELEAYDAELNGLWAEERRLKRLDNKAFELTVSGGWASLASELDEVNKVLKRKKRASW
jgi:hypothetical protein